MRFGVDWVTDCMAKKKSDIYSSLWASCDELRGGMDASLMSRMKELDEENKRLKKMYAEKSMQNDLLKEALGKKW